MIIYNKHAFDPHFEWNNQVYAVPAWFVNREFPAALLDDLKHSDDGYVLYETEKAVKIRWEGIADRWVPKSILITPEELHSSAIRALQTRQDNDRYYNYLRDVAKENGVKLGSVRKWSKIKEKLSTAGIAYLERNEYLQTC